MTGETVYVPKTPDEKAMQRALLQYYKPENREIVRKALIKAGRRDLIGNGPDCLIPDNKRKTASGTPTARKGKSSWQNAKGKQLRRK